MSETSTIFLFDVDGTLTNPRQKISSEMRNKLSSLKNKYTIGLVGGSDFCKMKEQIGDDILQVVDYVFSENGTVAYHHGNLIHRISMSEHIGENNFNDLVQICLDYIDKLELPVKTSNFVEVRNGMINVSPIGRNCSVNQRNEYEIYDHQHNIRKKLIEKVNEKFSHLSLKNSIGGQISFDCMPLGWDKTYCLRHITDFETIYFFGDKTFEGGNDYEIFHHPLVQGFTVDSPSDTIQFINKFI